MKKNNRNLFLDDVRFPNHVTWVDMQGVRWETVRSVQEFMDWVESDGVPERVSFDHDLIREHYRPTAVLPVKDTGFEACAWLLSICHKYSIEFPLWIIHSMNSRGAIKIKNLLEEDGISKDRGLAWSFPRQSQERNMRELLLLLKVKHRPTNDDSTSCKEFDDDYRKMYESNEG